MALVSHICTRAFRRSGVIDALHDPSADEMQAAVDALNDMHQFWRAKGVDTLAATFSQADAFVFFVPPSGEPIGDFTDKGAWNASTNSPALASGTGTQGDVYKVSVAGSTALDAVTSWAINDYAVFDGADWLKGKNSARHEPAVTALLAMRLCEEFGIDPKPRLVMDATAGWYSLMAEYIKPPRAGFDNAILDTATGRLAGLIE